jgi:hypothetical protein
MVMLKFPFASDETELEVFVSVIVAKDTGPLSSLTWPVILLEFWLNVHKPKRNNTASGSTRFPMVSFFINE